MRDCWLLVSCLHYTGTAITLSITVGLLLKLILISHGLTLEEILKLGNFAVFLTDAAVEKLNVVGNLWLKTGKSGSYLLCQSVNTESAFIDMEYEDNIVPGNMHLLIPHHFVRALLFGEKLDSFGFIDVIEETNGSFEADHEK